jgi:hypothetical protein
MKVRFAVVLAALLVGASAARAQEAVPLSQEQLNQRFEELDRWLTQYRKWEKWIALYGNRPAKTWMGNVESDRMQRPEPPPWLIDDCAHLIGYDGKLGQACDILRKWHGLAWHLKGVADNPVLTTTGGVVNDRVVKSSFWQRVHVTGLWAPAQLPLPSVRGVIGMQVGVVEIGRLTLPAVGVMLVTMTGRDGSREWRPATNIAISYRLRNFALNGHTVALHFNVSRVNIREAETVGPAAVPIASNFVGLSVSFKKGR